jgi:hypothetical protein
MKFIDHKNKEEENKIKYFFRLVVNLISENYFIGFQHRIKSK